MADDSTSPAPNAEGYSTNPSTIKARRRKMTLNGAKKHEEAARTADYKAMIYARKVIQDKPEYRNASDDEKKRMLENAMRETMEKRRAKGQDTMSKMAAYNAGESRRSTAGPMTSVPIADFLVSNGYVPASAVRGNHNRNRKQSLDAADCANNSLAPGPVATGHSSSGGPSSVAPVADMNGHGVNALASPNKMEISYKEQASVFSNNNPQPNGGPTLGGYNLFTSTRLPTSPRETKPTCNPAPFSNMTPEPGIMHSIKGESGQVAALRNEVIQLRKIVMTNGNPARADETFDVRAGLSINDHQMAHLNQRVCQLEGIVHAIQTASLITVDERVLSLERVVEQLKEKVGDGCDAEVAKMREVFGSLREAMARVGNFF